MSILGLTVPCARTYSTRPRCLYVQSYRGREYTIAGVRVTVACKMATDVPATQPATTNPTTTATTTQAMPAYHAGGSAPSIALGPCGMKCCRVPAAARQTRSPTTASASASTLSRFLDPGSTDSVSSLCARSFDSVPSVATWTD